MIYNQLKYNYNLFATINNNNDYDELKYNYNQLQLSVIAIWHL